MRRHQNPLKMNRVKKEIEAQLRTERDERRERKALKKARKKEKKEAKKAKKAAKKKDRKRDRSPSSSSSDSSGKSDDGGHKKRAEYASPPASSSVQGRREGYGLVAGTAKAYAPSELGPSADQRARAREAAVPAPVECKRPRVQLSEEERQRRLRAMVDDASTHEHQRNDRAKHEKATDAAAKAAAAAAAAASAAASSNPTFLQDMEKAVYVSGEMGMEERMKSKRQNYQKGGDLASGGFMAR